MQQKSHQKEVYQVAIHLMERRKNKSLTIASVPDEIERTKKAVDLHVRGDDTDYYIEHTLIESFPGQISDGSRIMELLAPLEKSLVGKLPRGHFNLTVASGAVAGATDIDKIQAALKKWILEKSPSLSNEASTKQRYTQYREMPTNLPFEVVLSCDPRLEDSFYIARFAPNELEKKRRERIQVALNNKCPKLKAAKTQHNSRSVLILESNDIALANQFLIASAFVDEVKKRLDDIPDEAYLVETDIPNQWSIWILKEDANYFPDITGYGPYYIDRKTSG
jgi:hypothetical protein